MKHGMWGTPTYWSWYNMKQRCNNTKLRDYRLYGGRGITYDPKWETFVGFFEDMGVRTEGLTLDRENGNLGYSKSNCRWATDKQQHRNTSRNKLSEEKVVLLRGLIAAKNPKVSMRKFADVVAPLFGCSPNTIRSVMYGAWA